MVTVVPGQGGLFRSVLSLTHGSEVRVGSEDAGGAGEEREGGAVIWWPRPSTHPPPREETRPVLSRVQRLPRSAESFSESCLVSTARPEPASWTLCPPSSAQEWEQEEGPAPLLHHALRLAEAHSESSSMPSCWLPSLPRSWERLLLQEDL